jgi:drug/metabolite transporter (DMT)-like permease
MSPRLTASLQLIAAAVLWSLGGLMIKELTWHPLGIVSVRCFLAALLVLALLRGRPRLTFSRGQVTASLAYAGAAVGFVLATKLTSAANAILLQYTSPLWVALLAPRLLGEPTQGRDWLFMALILGGMALFFVESLSPSGLAGNLAALGTGMCVACLALSLRGQDQASSTPIFLGNLLAALVCLPFVRPPWPDAQDWLILLVMGPLQLGLPYYLYSLAIRRVSALEASLLPMLEPVLNPIWVMLFLGERPGPWALAGGVIVLSSVLAWGVLRGRPSVTV